MKTVNLEKQTKSHIALYPNGRAWRAINDDESNLYGFAKSISEQIVDFKNFCYSILSEFFCETADKSMDLWLKEYNLPNVCDPRGETLCILHNGFPDGVTLQEIIEDCLLRLGVTATVIDESENGVYLTYSILINENSEVFQECFYVAGSTTNNPRVCGEPVQKKISAWVPNGDCENSAKAINLNTLTLETCGYYASGNVACDDALYASKNFIDLLPNLSCLFEQIIPLGFKVNFYLNDKNTPIEGI